MRRDRRYTGSFAITGTTPAGTVPTPVVSMRDRAGNRGVAIVTGGTLAIDTAGPRIIDLAIQPGNAIKNDPSAPETVTLTALFDSPVKAGTTPEFSDPLSNTAPTAVAVTSVAPGVDNLTWDVTILLPSTAGQTTEDLELSFSGVGRPRQSGNRDRPAAPFPDLSGRSARSGLPAVAHRGLPTCGTGGAELAQCRGCSRLSGLPAPVGRRSP